MFQMVRSELDECENGSVVNAKIVINTFKMNQIKTTKGQDQHKWMVEQKTEKTLPYERNGMELCHLVILSSSPRDKQQKIVHISILDH